MSTWETPPFVAYALGHECPLRTGRRPLDPLETERHLRPLRAYCEALLEGRILDGLCVADSTRARVEFPTEPFAFRIEPMLDAYGGLANVISHCGECPACAVRFQNAPAVAGCFGWLEFSSGSLDLGKQVDEVVASPHLQAAVAREFLATRPAWLGLWCSTPLRPAQLAVHLELAERLLQVSNHHGITAWHAAVQHALRQQLELHLVVEPRGTVVGRRWTTVAHCARCHADRSDGRTNCPVCGQHRGIAGSRTRCARGHRPFQPLRLLLGEQGATEFMRRYQDQKEPIHLPRPA